MKIIGQEKVTTDISKIFEIFVKSECQIRPHFIITGPSGSGKSITIKTLCEKHKLNYIDINAAQLTKEGTAGNSLSKALTPLLNASGRPTVVFVDEFCKLFISGNQNTDLAHETTNGVQNEFLKVLELKETMVFGDYGKYIPAKTGNVLFVFAGAFNGEKDITLDRLRDFGVKTEFLGRVGLVYNLQPLTLDNLIEILEESELLSKYLALFDNVIRNDVVTIISGYIRENYENNTIGARMINSLINQYFITGKLPETDVKKITFQRKMQISSE